MREFNDLDNDKEKVEYLRDILAPIAEKTGGSVRHVPKEDEVQCSGAYEKRSFRIIMDTDTGGLNIEMKLRNTVGIMDLNYDPEAESSADAPEPEWDEGEEQRHFLAPSFYLEGYPADLEKEKKILETLDPAEVELITALMTKLGIGWVKANSSFLSCGLFESLFDPAAILGLVQALHRYAAQFEKGGEQVAQAPSLVIGGVAVNPKLVAAIQTCPFCHSNVEVGKDRKCPNCGAGL